MYNADEFEKYPEKENANILYIRKGDSDTKVMNDIKKMDEQIKKLNPDALDFIPTPEFVDSRPPIDSVAFFPKVPGFFFNDDALGDGAKKLNGCKKMKEEIKKLHPDALIPTRQTKFAACKDLYSPIDAVVPAGKNLLIKTNIAIAWDNPNYYMQLLSRSGMAYKNNVVVQAGVIDFDYRSNIGVLLQNNSDLDFIIERGNRIAQYCYIKIDNTEKTEEVEEFTIPLDSDRNGGGFGSTGR